MLSFKYRPQAADHVLLHIFLIKKFTPYLILHPLVLVLLGKRYIFLMKKYVTSSACGIDLSLYIYCEL